MTMTPDAWIPLIERLEAVLDRALARWPEPAGMDESALAYRYRRIQGQMVMEPIRHARALAWEQLQEIDAQKSRFERNVLAFLAGFPANHMLLTGARGTGKSSLVKAAVLRWQAQGLRLVEVDKQDLLELPSLIDRLAGARLVPGIDLGLQVFALGQQGPVHGYETIDQPCEPCPELGTIPAERGHDFVFDKAGQRRINLQARLLNPFAHCPSHTWNRATRTGAADWFINDPGEEVTRLCRMCEEMATGLAGQGVGTPSRLG